MYPNVTFPQVVQNQPHLPRTIPSNETPVVVGRVKLAVEIELSPEGGRTKDARLIGFGAATGRAAISRGARPVVLTPEGDAIENRFLAPRLCQQSLNELLARTKLPRRTTLVNPNDGHQVRMIQRPCRVSPNVIAAFLRWRELFSKAKLIILGPDVPQSVIKWLVRTLQSWRSGITQSIVQLLGKSIDRPQIRPVQVSIPPTDEADVSPIGPKKARRMRRLLGDDHGFIFDDDGRRERLILEDGRRFKAKPTSRKNRGISRWLKMAAGGTSKLPPGAAPMAAI